MREPEQWDFWSDAAQLNCCGYDSSNDSDLIDVFIETGKENHWYEKIAAKLNLDKKYVCLLMEILCSADFCEYGTSPRGAWAIHKTYEANIEKLKEWYLNSWEEHYEANENV